MSSASQASSRPLASFWKELHAASKAGEDRPLPVRLAEAAQQWSGARAAALHLRDKDAWIGSGQSGDEAGTLLPPEPSPEAAGFVGETLWIPLAAEGEVHGQLGLLGVPAEEAPEVAAFLGFVLGAQVAAHRLSRQVKGAEFEIKTRLLELESLYDLGLSLGGQLDLGALADEVLFRSISLTDAGKGTLVLLDDGGRMLYERNLGGDFVPRDRFASWRIPDGEAVINNFAASLPTAGERLSGCEKCLAVSIAVPGRRLGFLAVADKESRDGRVLDFTATDARLLSLFANQAAAAIETARLHQDAIEKERIERELELAAAIQREILPRSLPAIPGVELAAVNIPARHIGGDYYDVFPLSEGRVAFLVADVSGKGVPAALLVSTVHAAVHLQIDEAKTIADLVSRIDRHLRRFAATRKFLTLFFGLLEPGTGVLRYVSAGHNPALLMRESGQREQLDSTGVPVGMLPNSSWREEIRDLKPGDLLCVYSDGLTEAVNAADEEFGLDRLGSDLSSRRALPLRQICDEVLGKVADFAQGMPQYDDQTVLLVRRT
ncbi:MAG: SpoIIE family protein phosphatase [Acidobacteria bacterium]|nr:SpoIIE family protein phosphatase [Acidobacteriota bacterium]